MALGWDPWLSFLGGASGGGGFSGARNPEPPRNFGWDCIPGGRDPGEAATDTQAVLD